MKLTHRLYFISALTVINSLPVLANDEKMEPLQVDTPSESISPYESWVAKKNDWNEKYGFQFNIDYTMLGFGATNPIGESTAAGGALRFLGQWDLVQQDNGDTGGIVFKFEHRHKYTDSDPKSFGFNDLGYLGFNHSLFGDQGFRTTHLFWRQTAFDERFVSYLGFLDMTDYSDIYALASPWTDFNNAVFTVGGGTIGGLPDGAFGAMVGGMMSENIYGSASIIDAKGNASDLIQGLEDFLDHKATWKSLELGYASSKDELFLNNAHITFWQRDAVDNDDAGHGVSVSISGLLQDSWLPFLRAGWATGAGALYDKSVSAGFGYIPKYRRSDMLGIAVNVANPMSSTLGGVDFDSQYTAELYYRAQVFPWLQISPSVQFMNYTSVDINSFDSNMSENGLVKNKDNVLFGLKAKFTF